MHDAWWIALALVLVLEGLMPAIHPQGWRRMFTQLLQLDEDLNQLGPVLEDRFKQEDRLVKALQVVESLSHQQV